MKLDTSAAPELAAWTLPAPTVAAPPRPQPAGRAPATVGYLAACLRILVADPASWWDRVRFDPHAPVCIPVAAPGPRCEAWLLVLPPGYRGDGAGEPAWTVGCPVAGEPAERTGDRTRPLAPGRIRVRGGPGPGRMVNTGAGFAVSLHARPAQVACANLDDSPRKPFPPVPAGL